MSPTSLVHAFTVLKYADFATAMAPYMLPLYLRLDQVPKTLELLHWRQNLTPHREGAIHLFQAGNNSTRPGVKNINAATRGISIKIITKAKESRAFLFVN